MIYLFMFCFMFLLNWFINYNWFPSSGTSANVICALIGAAVGTTVMWFMTHDGSPSW